MVHYSNKSKGKAFGRYKLRAGDREKLEILAEIKDTTAPEVVGEWVAKMIDMNEMTIQQYQSKKQELSNEITEKLKVFKSEVF